MMPRARLPRFGSAQQVVAAAFERLPDFFRHRLPKGIFEDRVDFSAQLCAECCSVCVQ